MVEELISFSPQDLSDLNALMQELSATSRCGEAQLKSALADANVHVFVMRDGRHIVATWTLCIKHTLEFSIADIESVEVALCLWWIDSTLKRLENGVLVQRFSPRRKGSNWSSHNLARCKRLVHTGEMTPVGLAVLSPEIRAKMNASALGK